MKSLTLIRHAKSSWSSTELKDHDRPLNERGEADAPKMGKFLAGIGFTPQVFLSSTAARALATARIIAREVGVPPESIREDARIYHATVPVLLRVLAEIGEEFESAAVFGHNAGLGDLGNVLVPGGRIARFPTCAVAHIELDIGHWGEIDAGCGQLRAHFYPKMLP